MPEATATHVNKPVWIDLASPDAAASREFYARLFGWQLDVSPDPRYGGYATARLEGRSVAGIGPKPAPEAPTAWSVYIGTGDPEGLVEQVTSAGGSVLMAPIEVGTVGRMAVFQDPAGAVISAFQPGAEWRQEDRFHSGVPNTFAWAELTARGIDEALPFYRRVFGWTPKTSETGAGGPTYTEFQLEGRSVAGGMEMSPMVPAQVPSYWMVYFGVADVDRSFRQALAEGAEEMVAPEDYPGGRFAILRDPQGAAFGLLSLDRS